MKIVKADAKGRVTGFEPGQRYSVVEEAEAQWVRAHPEEVTGDSVGQTVGLVLGNGDTMWGNLKLLQHGNKGVMLVLTGKEDYVFGSEDYSGSLVTHVWVKR